MMGVSRHCTHHRPACRGYGSLWHRARGPLGGVACLRRLTRKARVAARLGEERRGPVASGSEEAPGHRTPRWSSSTEHGITDAGDVLPEAPEIGKGAGQRGGGFPASWQAARRGSGGFWGEETGVVALGFSPSAGGLDSLRALFGLGGALLRS